MSDQIQEVFGQFAVEINGKVELFPSHAEAAVALSKFENEAEFIGRAEAFAASLGLSDKAAKGKSNVALAFLLWEAAGSPEYVAPEKVTEEDSTEDAIDDVDGESFGA
jgi:hypothetical protein